MTINVLVMGLQSFAGPHIAEALGIPLYLAVRDESAHDKPANGYNPP